MQTRSLNLIVLSTHLALLCAQFSGSRSQDQLPPDCLGQLARNKRLASQAAAESRYCNPGEFVEIEFTLRFGCDVPTHIDQGVRFEVDRSPASSETRDWQPVRFYTPTLTPAPPQKGKETRVTLEEGGRSVHAVAGSYSSSLPLINLNSSVGVAEGVVIREYLCQDYVSHLRNGNRFRLRWMQRYLTNPQADVATWSLDNLRIRIWNGTCFLPLLSEDFNNHTISSPPGGIRLAAMTGGVASPPCAMDDSVLYFNEALNSDIRRSLLVTLENYSLENTCIDPETTCADGSGVNEDSCPIPMEGSGGSSLRPFNINMTITCSRGNVSCGCGSRMSDGGLTCEDGEIVTEAPPAECLPPNTTEVMTTTKAPPTTTEVEMTSEAPSATSETTEALPTTTETMTTTTDAPPTTTEAMTTTEAPPSTTEAMTITDAPPTTTEAMTTTDAPPTTTDAMTTAEAAPTTTEVMATTLAMTTTESITTTMESAPISTVMVNDDTSISKFSDEELATLVNQYSGGSAPLGVSKAVLAAAGQAFRDIAMGADPSEAGRVLNFLDNFALRAYNSSNGPIETDSYTMNVTDVKMDKPAITTLKQQEGSISLPNQLFTDLEAMMEDDNFRVASFLFKDLSDSLPLKTETNTTNVSIISSVVSASVGGCGLMPCPTGNLNLSAPIRIQLQHTAKMSEEEKMKNNTFSCYFLDIGRNEWSTKGCERLDAESNSTFSVCECQHLTHFAILLSPGAEIDSGNEFALTVIGYVGVGISLVCMALTVLVFIFFKPLWGMRTFIHINLCVSLGLAQLLFITAVDKTQIPELCQAIAIVLHYLFLVSFMWMLMEGVVLYVVLVRVFIKQQRWYMLGFAGVSYGLPALYMGLVVPLGLALGNGPHYGGDETCWLRYDSHFIWAFIIPVILIILTNIGFFIMAVRIMYKHEKKGAKKSRFEYASTWLKTSISLLVVMGITWIIGVLIFHGSLLFVAYIFTICVAFQGAIIFILFVVFSKQVREAYRSWWRSKKSESALLSSMFPSQGERKRSFSRSSMFSSRRRGTLTSTLHSSTAKDETDIKLEKYKSLSEHNGYHSNHYDVEKPPIANGHTPASQPLTNGTAYEPPNHTLSSKQCHSPSPQPSVRLEEVKVLDDQEKMALDGGEVGESNSDERTPLGESYFEVHITSS